MRSRDDDSVLTYFKLELANSMISTVSKLSHDSDRDRHEYQMNRHDNDSTHRRSRQRHVTRIGPRTKGLKDRP